VLLWSHSAFTWYRAGCHPLLGEHACDQDGVHVWTARWDDAVVTYLSNHRVGQMAVVPGSCFLELLAPAVEELYGDAAYELKNVVFERMLVLDAFFLKRPVVRVSLKPVVSNDRIVKMAAYAVSIESVFGAAEDTGSSLSNGVDERWTRHATMQVEVAQTTTDKVLSVVDINGLGEA